ncbi:hypothetical protein ACVWW6_000211 [Bradyrhizobium sp. USDA 3311]
MLRRSTIWILKTTLDSREAPYAQDPQYFKHDVGPSAPDALRISSSLQWPRSFVGGGGGGHGGLRTRKSGCGNSFGSMEFQQRHDQPRANPLDPLAFKQAFRCFIAPSPGQGTKLTAVVRSTARRREAPKGKASAPRRCPSSMSSPPKRGWYLLGAWRRAVTRPQGGWKNSDALARSCIAAVIAIAPSPTRARTRRSRRPGPLGKLLGCLRRSSAALELGQAHCGRKSSSQAPTIDRIQGLPSSATDAWGWQTAFPQVAAIGSITSRRRLHGAPRKLAGRYYVLSRYMPAKRSKVFGCNCIEN